jgi:hypothetical protein
MRRGLKRKSCGCNHHSDGKDNGLKEFPDEKGTQEELVIFKFVIAKIEKGAKTWRAFAVC